MDAPDLTVWQQFGFVGVVVGALFGLVGYTQRAHNKTLDQTLTRLTEGHKEERNEWRNSAAKRDEKVAKAIEELAHELREQRLSLFSWLGASHHTATGGPTSTSDSRKTMSDSL